MTYTFFQYIYANKLLTFIKSNIKMTDWNKISKEEMGKVSSDTKKIQIKFFRESIKEQEDYLNSPEIVNERLLDTTGDMFVVYGDGESLFSSFYCQDNEYFEFPPKMTQAGSLQSLYSYENKVIILLEFNDELVKDYHPIKNKFTTILDVKRDDIIGFEIEDNKKYRAAKQSNTQAFVENHKRSIAMMSRGLIPGLIVGGILKAVASSEDDSIEKTGTIFNLIFFHNKKKIKLAIACEEINKENFSVFLNEHWKNTAPQIKKQNIKDLKNAKVHNFPRMLKIGDWVIIKGWFSSDIGLIIDIKGVYAKVRVTTDGKTGEIKEMKYDKLVKIYT